MKYYWAKLVDKRPDGVLILHAYVDEYSAASLKGATIKELMFAKVFAFRRDEVSRKEIEHGPTKYPGLDILMRQDGIWTRKVLVAASPRL